MKVLQGSIGIEVLWGEPKPGAPPHVCFRFRHKKLPEGGVMFMMPSGHADSFASMVRAVLDGGGMLESSTTVRGEPPQ